jgi:hypothetical protein
MAWSRERFLKTEAKMAGSSDSSSCTNTSRMGVLVISCAVMIPVEASCAHTLSTASLPGMPRATMMRQPSSSISFLAATARSLKPGTVRRMVVKTVP